MKPDKITCNNCGKPINSGKWCSDKCRMAFKRLQGEQTRTELLPEHEQTVPEQTPEQLKAEQLEQKRTKAKEEASELREQLNKTDRTFLDRAIYDFQEPYYRFELDNVREGTCGQCNAKFKTTLSLNKYCSYRHYQEALGK